jgi:hypothetical protein
VHLAQPLQHEGHVFPELAQLGVDLFVVSDRPFAGVQRVPVNDELTQLLDVGTSPLVVHASTYATPP